MKKLYFAVSLLLFLQACGDAASQATEAAEEGNMSFTVSGDHALDLSSNAWFRCAHQEGPDHIKINTRRGQSPGVEINLPKTITPGEYDLTTLAVRVPGIGRIPPLVVTFKNDKEITKHRFFDTVKEGVLTLESFSMTEGQPVKGSLSARVFSAGSRWREDSKDQEILITGTFDFLVDASTVQSCSS